MMSLFGATNPGGTWARHVDETSGVLGRMSLDVGVEIH